MKSISGFSFFLVLLREEIDEQILNETKGWQRHNGHDQTQYGEREERENKIKSQKPALILESQGLTRSFFKCAILK